MSVFVSHVPDAYFWKSSPGFTDRSRDVRSTPHVPRWAFVVAADVCATAPVDAKAVDAARRAPARNKALNFWYRIKIPRQCNEMRLLDALPAKSPAGAFDKRRAGIDEPIEHPRHSLSARAAALAILCAAPIWRKPR